jgi:hypothetical protein
MEHSKIKREATLLVLVVFVLGVFLGGLGNHVWGERVWGFRSFPGPRSHQVVGDLTQELQLSTDQQKQLNAIVDDTKARIHAADAPADAQREQLRQQANEPIRAILTQEQLPKFEAFMQRMAEQRKRDGGERPSPR